MNYTKYINKLENVNEKLTITVEWLKGKQYYVLAGRLESAQIIIRHVIQVLQELEGGK